MTAETLVVAFGYLQATKNPSPDAILTEGSLPTALWRRLGTGRRELLPVLLSAGRAYRALRAVDGSGLSGLKAQTWAACFGTSLLNALAFGQEVIRPHHVLVLGETGTGKELVSAAIRAGTIGGSVDGQPSPMSPPSTAFNAAAIPESLRESELFGHVKGAATDIKHDRMGKIRSAHLGTCFIDEVAELSLSSQAALLRCIQEGTVQPVGADAAAQKVDVRYVAATHRDLEQLVDAGKFRGDLLHRLAGTVIRTPALREHPEDIPVIGLAYVRRLTAKMRERRGGVPRFDDIEQWLRSSEVAEYGWPGNIRELQSAIRSRLLGLAWKPSKERAGSSGPEGSDPSVPAGLLEANWSEAQVTDWYLRRVVAKCGGNRTKAATVLELDRNTVSSRLGRTSG